MISVRPKHTSFSQRFHENSLQNKPQIRRNCLKFELPQQKQDKSQNKTADTLQLKQNIREIKQYKIVKIKGKQSNLSNSKKNDRVEVIQRMSNQLNHGQQNKLQGIINEKVIENLNQDKFKEQFRNLFQLFANQQILKHYCEKSQWKFQSRIMQKMVFPTLDLLSIRKSNIKQLFQPYLTKITQKYLLKTQIDTFSMLSPSALLIQLTETWIKIKQSQIKIKRFIRSDIKWFKKNFCTFFHIQQNTKQKQKTKTYINWKQLHKFIFQDTKQIKMVSVLKLFIFMERVHGTTNNDGKQLRDFRNNNNQSYYQKDYKEGNMWEERSLEQWLDSY